MKKNVANKVNKLFMFVESNFFQYFILIVILINVLILGLQTGNFNIEIKNLLNVCDKVCLTIFIIEIILKLIAYNKVFFKFSWNIFDFIIILASVIPEFSSFIVFRVLRVLRTLKAIRIIKAMKSIRILKLISGLKHLQLIFKAIIKSLPGILWTVVLLLLFFYIYSIIGVNIFGNNFPELYGSLGKAMFTLFQVMTFEAWSMSIARPIMVIYPFAWIYFISFVLLSAFIMMNVVIGIVVDSIRIVSTEEEKNEKIGMCSKTSIEEEFEKLKKQIEIVEKLICDNYKKPD